MIILLCGLSGAGKTTLANLYINTYTHDITECTGMLLTFIQQERHLLSRQYIAC